MLSIVDVIKESAGYTKPMRSGEELLRSGMVISVGKKEKKNNIIHVQALVMRTSGLNSKHPAIIKLWIDVSQDYGNRLVGDNEQEVTKVCDCPAGASEKCKHISCHTLSLKNRGGRSGGSEKQWGTLKTTSLKEYEAKSLSEMCHVKGQRDIYVRTMPEVTKEMESHWRMKLMQSTPNSEYSIFTSFMRRGDGLVDHGERVISRSVDKTFPEKLLTFNSWRYPPINVLRKLTEEKLKTCKVNVIEFYKRYVTVSLDQSTEIINAKQGTPNWHKARKVRQTASKARAQFTYYSNKNADCDKRYQEVFHSNFLGNEDTIRGLRCEAVARDLYAEHYGCTILESGLLVRPELPWLSASLDGTAIDIQGNFLRNIEIKTLKEGTRLTADELIEMNAIPILDKNQNKKFTNHYTQIQLGMFLSGITECDYLVYSEIGKDLAVKRVSFDENHILEICLFLVNVYFEKFLPRIVNEYESNCD